jgi:hypothetical protein
MPGHTPWREIAFKHNSDNCPLCGLNRHVGKHGLINPDDQIVCIVPMLTMNREKLGTITGDTVTDRIKDIPANPNSLLNGPQDPTPEKGEQGSKWRTFISYVKGFFVTSVLFLMVGCVPPRPPTPQPPTPQPPVFQPDFDLVACYTPPANNYCSGPNDGVFTLTPNSVAQTPRVQYSDGDGYTFVREIPSTWTDVNLQITASGYLPFNLTNVNPLVWSRNNAQVTPSGDHVHNFFVLQPVPPPPFPPAPLRASVLNVHITGQGMYVNTQQFGTLPWWEAALTYLNPADRNAVYVAKHASTAWPGGDTHAIIAVPSGRALYDEPNQPYSADRFPPLDWTNGGTQMVPEFDALVIEVIQNGFIPMIFLDETMDTSFKTLPVVINALQHSPQGDLTPYVIIGPGWDGVFYGWEPSHTVIPQWAANARALCPNCYLFIEHNVGHIPLGEGPSDWCPTCLMKDFDLLLSEFWDGVFDDTVWQIGARTIGLVSKGGTYVRPPDQPAGDDPNAPFYLAPGNNRGPFLACAFEFGMYGWVRQSSTAAQQASWRQYFKNIGYVCGG